MDFAATAPAASAFEAELLAMYPALVRRLALVLRDPTEAEDVAQSAFARAWEARARFSGGDLRAWFFTIGLRLAFNERRRRRRADLRVASPPVWAVKSDPDLWAALAQIDPQPRAALLLNVIDGYTQAEIAAILGVRPGTVASWLSRSKERLRGIIGED